jgi:hypothetical protein
MNILIVLSKSHKDYEHSVGSNPSFLTLSSHPDPIRVLHLLKDLVASRRAYLGTPRGENQGNDGDSTPLHSSNRRDREQEK